MAKSTRRRVWSWADEKDIALDDTYEDHALRAIASWELWVRSGANLESVPRDPMPLPRPGARARVSRSLAQRAESLCVNPQLARLAAEAAQAPGAEGAESAGVLAEQWWRLWHGGGLGPILLQLLLRTDARPVVLELWAHVELDLGLSAECVALLHTSLQLGRPDELVPLLQRVACLAERPGYSFWRSLDGSPEGTNIYGLLADLCWDILGVSFQRPAEWQTWTLVCGEWAMTPPWEEPRETAETTATLTPASLVHATSSWDDSSSRWGATPTSSDVGRDADGYFDLAAEDLQSTPGTDHDEETLVVLPRARALTM